jgi:hypothetical protein
MVAPEVVGQIDPVDLFELKTNGKPGNRRAASVGGESVAIKVPIGR